MLEALLTWVKERSTWPQLKDVTQHVENSEQEESHGCQRQHEWQRPGTTKDEYIRHWSVNYTCPMYCHILQNRIYVKWSKGLPQILVDGHPAVILLEPAQHARQHALGWNTSRGLCNRWWWWTRKLLWLKYQQLTGHWHSEWLTSVTDQNDSPAWLTRMPISSPLTATYQTAAVFCRPVNEWRHICRLNLYPYIKRQDVSSRCNPAAYLQPKEAHKYWRQSSQYALGIVRYFCFVNFLKKEIVSQYLAL